MNNYKFGTNILNLTILSILWGPTALIMKLAIHSISPIAFISTSSLIAAILLLVYTSIIKKEPIYLDKITIYRLFVTGLLIYSIPTILQCYAVQNIPSIWVGIIVAVTPVIIAISSHYHVPNERLTKRGFTGIFFGFLGFLTLAYANHEHDQSSAQIISLLLVLAAVVSCSIGLIYAKKNYKYLKHKSTPAMQFLISSIYLIPISFFIDNNYFFDLKSAVNLKYVFLYAIVCTAAAYMYYYKLLKSSSANFLAMVNYLLPLIKTILGAIFLHEAIDMPIIMSLVFIFTGLKLVNSAEKRSLSNAETIS